MLLRNPSKDQPPRPNVPVTPMLDMAFQLLAFFIFTFHGDAQYEVEMDLALPQDTSGRAADPSVVDMNKASDKLPEMEDLNDVPTITAATQNDGKNNGTADKLTIQDRTGVVKSVDILQDDDSLKNLVTMLKNDYPAEDNKGVIKVRGDPRLKWSAVLKVMDACHKAGYTRVGFAAPLED
jgi:biopolymer transport protein ExbD